MEVLWRQHAQAPLGPPLETVCQALASGQPLSRSFGREGDIFDTMYVALVRAGELQGNLHHALTQLATYLERDANLRARVRAALTYPLFVLGVTVALTLWFFSYVLPSFMPMFSTLKSLPLATRLLIFCVSVTTNPWLMGGGALAGAAAFTFARQWLRQPSGEAFRDGLLLRFFVSRELTRKIVLARVARSLASMMATALPIMDALLQVANTCGNAVYQDDLLQAREALKAGTSLSEYFQANPLLYPQMFVQMVASGEEAGQLTDLLQRIADTYEQDVEYALEAALTLLEPALMAGLAVLVGFIAIGLFLPVYGFVGQMS